MSAVFKGIFLVVCNFGISRIGNLIIFSKINFMKIISLGFIIFVSVLLSCKKNDTGNLISVDNTKVRSIFYGKDTIVPLCATCVPVITQNSEYFFYDGLDRLILRILTTATISNNLISIDTTAIYKYSYLNTSSLIVGYTENLNSGTDINHTLNYDSQNRLIIDSVTNPQVSNNKISRYIYLLDTIIQYEKQVFPVGTITTLDTMLISGNNIIHEKIISGSSFRELSYTISTYRNPFSYINNFNLLASDYKNGSNSLSFPISTAQNITYNIATQTEVKYWNGTSTPTQYTTLLTPTLDSLGRINTISNSSNGNKTTTFTYY